MAQKRVRALLYLPLDEGDIADAQNANPRAGQEHSMGDLR